MKIIIAIFLVLTIVIVFNKKKNKNESNNMLGEPIYFINENPDLDYNEPLNETLEKVIKKMLFNYQKYGYLNSLNSELNELLENTKKPLLVVIMGEFKAGKSTFINTLIGLDCLKSDVTPATAAVTMLSYGETPSIRAYFVDGSEKEYPFEDLEKLSAEGNEEMADIRQNLRYLEVKLASEILKNITIIDTPGLNADNPLHTKVTTEFIDKADSVLWLFSYTKVGSRSEIAMIQNIGDNMKPIGIINRIDEHDEEEEDLEDFLEDARRRIGKHLSKLIGVSALLAKQARETGDNQKLKDSRWQDFEKIINEEIISNSSNKKCKSTLVKLNDLTKKYTQKINEAKTEYEEAYSAVNETSNYIKTLNENFELLKNFKDRWIVNKDYLLTIYNNPSLPDAVKDSGKLNSQKKLLMSVFHELKSEESLLLKRRQEIESAIASHNREQEILNEDVEEFNHSGFFGGAPIFDFKGEKRSLMNRQNDINSRANTLNYESERFQESANAFDSRFERNEEDGRTFCTKVVDSIEDTLNKIKEKKKEILKNENLYRDKLNSLKWVDDLLKHTEFNREISDGIGFVSKNIFVPDKKIAEGSSLAYLETASDRKFN